MNDHHPYTLLLIDDEMVLLENIAFFLRSKGYHVFEAESGEQGLLLAKKHAPIIDVILLDIMMPDISGDKVLEALKNDDTTRHIPVIIQTGLTAGSEIEKVKQLGCAEIMHKPYSIKEMIDIIRKYTDD
jgi:CheY-like chemotaxis protein